MDKFYIDGQFIKIPSAYHAKIVDSKLLLGDRHFPLKSLEGGRFYFSNSITMGNFKLPNYRAPRCFTAVKVGDGKVIVIKEAGGKTYLMESDYYDDFARTLRMKNTYNFRLSGYGYELHSGLMTRTELLSRTLKTLNRSHLGPMTEIAGQSITCGAVLDLAVNEPPASIRTAIKHIEANTRYWKIANHRGGILQAPDDTYVLRKVSSNAKITVIKLREALDRLVSVAPEWYVENME